MGTHDRPPRPEETWAYGYEISPAMSPDRLAVIERLLQEENTTARLETRTWQGRFVTEEQVTHILVVSDSPDQERAINRRLEEAFGKLKAGFSLTPATSVPRRPATAVPARAAGRASWPS